MEASKKTYLFYNTCYGQEQLRRQTILFNDYKIRYKLEEKAVHSTARQPQAGYFEVDVLVFEDDLSKADQLMSSLNQQ